MTEKLKQLMHARAEAEAFATPDVDTLVRAGDRRLRHRRVAVVGGLSALAVAGALLVPSLGGGGPRAVDPAGPAAGTAEVSWATGETIHAGDREIPVGHAVRAYVRTVGGYVFADPDGTVWSWADGEATEVGRTDADRLRLVSDDEGSLAGWVDPTGDRPAFVVLDQADGSTTRVDEQDPAYFYGIDGRTAYWRDARGAVAVDLDDGTVREVDDTARDSLDLLDVEDGVIAFEAGDDGTAIGPTRDGAVLLPDVYGSQAVFSPDARWVSIDADEPQVYDAATGERVGFDLDHRFATGFDWLDDSTVVMLAAARPAMDAQVDLLACSVPGGDCEVAVAGLGTFEELRSAGFALPVGEAIESD